MRPSLRPSKHTLAGLECFSQLLQQTEHFCRRRQQEVAKIVPSALPFRTKVAGRVPAAFFLCQVVLVSSAGDKADSYVPSDSHTGISMEVPIIVNPNNLPLSPNASGYLWVSPNKVIINGNGAFARRISTRNDLPRFGNYAPGSLRSRVLQLLHEVGHLVVVRSNVLWIVWGWQDGAYALIVLQIALGF